MSNDVKIGTIGAARAEGEQIILTIHLDQPLSATDVRDHGVIAHPKGDFRTGAQIGVGFTPLFSGVADSGPVEISILNDIAWAPGTAATNAPLFVGLPFLIRTLLR